MKLQTFYPREAELARKAQPGVGRVVSRRSAIAKRALGGHCGGQQQFTETMEAYEVRLAIRFQLRSHLFKIRQAIFQNLNSLTV